MLIHIIKKIRLLLLYPHVWLVTLDILYREMITSDSKKVKVKIIFIYHLPPSTFNGETFASNH